MDRNPEDIAQDMTRNFRYYQEELREVERNRNEYIKHHQEVERLEKVLRALQDEMFEVLAGKRP